jgi:hypothetical protein
MRALLLFILLIPFVGYGQRIIVNGHKHAGGGGETQMAQWNFSISTLTVEGYNNVVAGPSSIVDRTSTDPTTGWTLTVNGAQWNKWNGFAFALGNGEGGSSDPGAVYTDFPEAAMQGGWINGNHSFASHNTTYPMEFANLPAGTYRLTVIGSVKASVLSSLVNGWWYVKFGSASVQSDVIAEQANYTGPALQFTGTIGTGEKLQFGPFSELEAANYASNVNCIRLEKL